MSFANAQDDLLFRRNDKEPEWSSICDNVFDQYDDHDDPFYFGGEARERSSSDDSVGGFDFSGSSEQSHQTGGTSPISSSESKTAQNITVEAQQPRAREAGGFWSRTLRTLEHNAAKVEKLQQPLCTAKSHPDFLSLGGHPSPPAVPLTPDGRSRDVPQRGHRTTANGMRHNITARSVSRGRPSGVNKSTVAGSANPYATIRKPSASPNKMMTPSRYRAGFKDLWNDKLQSSPQKYELRAPPPAFTGGSPPSSARAPPEDHFAAFGSPHGFYSFGGGYDEQLSPLTTTFQHARIHTPIPSPSTKNLAYTHSSYFEPLSTAQPVHQPNETGHWNDTAPLYPERNLSLEDDAIKSFDFGFSSPADLDAEKFFDTTTSHYTTDNTFSPFAGLDDSVLPSTEPSDFPSSGLGISCDPSTLSPAYPTSMSPTASLQPSAFAPRPMTSTGPLYYTPAPQQPPHPHHSLPTHTRSKSYAPTHTRAPSRTPSPTSTHSTPRSHHRRHRSPTPGAWSARRNPATPTSASCRKTSTHTPRHRRSKSTTACTGSTGPSHSGPRPAHHGGSPHKGSSTSSASAGGVGGAGGFVNFTPMDSGRILNGVAPSGSSKTKARREKEAAEKRRRFSQAALRAVVEAGGDPGGLVY